MLNEVYSMLCSKGLVSSKAEFCREWLNKAENYISRYPQGNIGVWALIQVRLHSMLDTDLEDIKAITDSQIKKHLKK